MEENDILYDMSKFICSVENNYGEVLEVMLKCDEGKTLSYLYKYFDYGSSKYSTQAREYPISNKKWFDFIQALYEIRLVEWVNVCKEEYIFNNAQWGIQVYLQDVKILVKRGEGRYHSQWENFIRALENLIDKSIEIEMVNYIN